MCATTNALCCPLNSAPAGVTSVLKTPQPNTSETRETLHAAQDCASACMSDTRCLCAIIAEILKVALHTAPL